MKLLGQEIAPLGMGCWAIGGDMFVGEENHGFANVNDAESKRTIHAALDAGITVFDTAIAYGAGHAERLLGEALANRPDTMIVSKLGTSIDENTRHLLDDYHDAASVRTAIDESLGRLQRDRIDIMLLHLNELPVEKATPMFEEMERARQAGKIRAYGWSTDVSASVDAMAPMKGFESVQHAMNVFIDASAVQASVEQNDLLAFIRSPLAMGILTGKFDAGSTIDSHDVRAKNHSWRDYFRDAKVSPKYLDNLAAIRELLQSDGRTLSQGALCWLLAKSNRNIPIPGARTVAQMQENAGALDHGPLPAGVMAEIETLIQRDSNGKALSR